MKLAGNIMVLALGVLVLNFSFSAEAQQEKNVPRIGFLRVAAAPKNYIDAFRAGLRDAGYVEGQNYTLEFKWAEGKADQLAASPTNWYGRA